MHELLRVFPNDVIILDIGTPHCEAKCGAHVGSAVRALRIVDRNTLLLEVSIEYEKVIADVLR